MTEETYDASGALLSRTTSPFAKMFVIRRATGGRWLNVAVLPPKEAADQGGDTRRIWSALTSCNSVVVPFAQSIRTFSAIGAASRPK